MQNGKTALEKAMDKKHHEIVNYLISKYQVNISQLDVICYIDDIVFCACNVIVGIPVGGLYNILHY